MPESWTHGREVRAGDEQAWYQINRPLNMSGFETDSFNRDAEDSFDELLDTFLASNIVIYESKIYLEGLRTRAVIQSVTTDVLNNAAMRQILCKIGTLACGYYIDDGKNFWMVCTLPDNNKMYEKAIMWHCKHRIKFISPVSGDIVEYPVYSINSTQYGTGETNRALMGVHAGQHLVYIPCTDETILLKNGYRIFMDVNRKNPTAYRITQIDPLSYSAGENGGLIQWSMIQDQNRDTDDIANMIADNTATENKKGNW